MCSQTTHCSDVRGGTDDGWAGLQHHFNAMVFISKRDTAHLAARAAESRPNNALQAYVRASLKHFISSSGYRLHGRHSLACMFCVGPTRIGELQTAAGRATAVNAMRFSLESNGGDEFGRSSLSDL